MNLKNLLAVLAACLIAIGCGSGGGLSGKYTATAAGGMSMSIEFDGANFTMTSPMGAGKGTYTKDGNKVTLNITETDGKPASDADKKKPLELLLSDDGNTLDGPMDMDFKKQ